MIYNMIDKLKNILLITAGIVIIAFIVITIILSLRLDSYQKSLSDIYKDLEDAKAKLEESKSDAHNEGIKSKKYITKLEDYITKSSKYRNQYITAITNASDLGISLLEWANFNEEFAKFNEKTAKQLQSYYESVVKYEQSVIDYEQSLKNIILNPSIEIYGLYNIFNHNIGVGLDFNLPITINIAIKAGIYINLNDIKSISFDYTKDIFIKFGFVWKFSN